MRTRGSKFGRCLSEVINAYDMCRLHGRASIGTEVHASDSLALLCRLPIRFRNQSALGAKPPHYRRALINFLFDRARGKKKVHS